MQILAGIDFDRDAGRTFSRNFPEAFFLLEDIRTLRPFSLEKFIPKERSVPLLFSACAPCQPFSRQKTQRKRDDARVNLLDELHRFVRVFRPDYVFVENVPGVQRITENQGPLGRFVSLISDLGYEYRLEVLKAQDYGVPQRRERVVLIAGLSGKLSMPCPTHGPNSPNSNYERVWDWISDLPPIRAGETHPKFPNHRAAALSELNLQRIRSTPEGGGRLDWPEHLWLNCHKDHSGHSDVYGRLHKDRPAMALTTRCVSLSNGRYGHPEQHRALSVREAARLQTFPDDFEFVGTLNSMARQIGNAVPVKLAEIFGHYFQDHSRAFLCSQGAE